MVVGTGEWEYKECTSDTPEVETEWDELSVLDLEWNVGVWATSWATENFVTASSRSLKVSGRNLLADESSSC